LQQCSTQVTFNAVAVKRKVGHRQSAWAAKAVIGHPSENNARPHATGTLAVVHNGIIETLVELCRVLEARGTKFRAESDNEVAAHLVSALMNRGVSGAEAVKRGLPRPLLLFRCPARLWIKINRSARRAPDRMASMGQ
jgi:glucosamine 6-phosphate synthetase-like amidotransferase/phosphosugar isomerase protein